jgi:hypothetical protein
MGVFVSADKVTRLKPNGSMDSGLENTASHRFPSLAPTGPALLQLGSTNVAFIATMAIRNDGKIVVAGETGDAAGNIAVARHLA